MKGGGGIPSHAPVRHRDLPGHQKAAGALADIRRLAVDCRKSVKPDFIWIVRDDVGQMLHLLRQAEKDLRITLPEPRPVDQLNYTLAEVHESLRVIAGEARFTRGEHFRIVSPCPPEDEVASRVLSVYGHANTLLTKLRDGQLIYESLRVKGAAREAYRWLDHGGRIVYLHANKWKVAQGERRFTDKTIDKLIASGLAKKAKYTDSAGMTTAEVVLIEGAQNDEPGSQQG